MRRFVAGWLQAMGAAAILTPVTHVFLSLLTEALQSNLRLAIGQLPLGLSAGVGLALAAHLLPAGGDTPLKKVLQTGAVAGLAFFSFATIVSMLRTF